jgi:hypothetical protein
LQRRRGGGQGAPASRSKERAERGQEGPGGPSRRRMYVWDADARPQIRSDQEQQKRFVHPLRKTRVLRDFRNRPVPSSLLPRPIRGHPIPFHGTGAKVVLWPSCLLSLYIVPYCPFVPGAASTQELQPGNIVAQRGEGMAGWEALRMGYSTFPSSSSSLSHSPSTAVPAPKHSSCRCSRARKGDTAGPSIPRTRLHQSAHQHPIPSPSIPHPYLCATREGIPVQHIQSLCDRSDGTTYTGWAEVQPRQACTRSRSSCTVAARSAREVQQQ